MDKRLRNYVCQECGEKIDWHEHKMFSGCCEECGGYNDDEETRPE